MNTEKLDPQISSTQLQERLIPKRRILAALVALMTASAISVCFLLVRAVASGEYKFSFFPGNLLLAWIPLLAALGFNSLRVRRSRRKALFVFSALTWFFFYPNAPYLITDLVHLKTRLPIPRWYDLVMMMSFAWTGLFLGYLSLYLMQEAVREWKGRVAGWCFAISMLALGALGVFVGRFWRWNSWEVLTNPLHLTGDVVRWLGSDAPQRIGKMPPTELAYFMATFFAFSLLIYLTMYTMTHLHGYLDEEDAAQSAE